MTDGWRKKFKGNLNGGAWIYIHPLLQRAIVSNHNGINYNGIKFSSLQEAKDHAISAVK